jgi:hypothetical protein
MGAECCTSEETYSSNYINTLHSRERLASPSRNPVGAGAGAMHNFTLFSTEENSTEIDNILDNLPKKVRNFFEIEGYYISKPRK